jgi:hypothetical protein
MTTGQDRSRKTARDFSNAASHRIEDRLWRARRRAGPLIGSVPLP